MTDSNYNSDSESAAMAAAMGFSSFGGKPAQKKRKFNPTTDAFVEGQALENIDRGGKKGTGSGGNMIPLGRARVLGGKERGVGDEEMMGWEGEEIGGAALGEEMREGDDGNFGSITMVRGGGDSSEGEGPQYIDSSRMPPAVEDDGPQHGGTGLILQTGPANTEISQPTISDAEAQEMQRRIDAIMQSIGSAPPPPSNDVDVHFDGSETPRHISSLPPRIKNLPNRPASAAAFGGGSRGGYENGQRGGHGNSGNGGRGGGRNEKWYMGYYDPSFNVNPWQALEKERGLEPMGSWLEYPKNQGRGGQRA